MGSTFSCLTERKADGQADFTAKADLTNEITYVAALEGEVVEMEEPARVEEEARAAEIVARGREASMSAAEPAVRLTGCTQGCFDADAASAYIEFLGHIERSFFVYVFPEEPPTVPEPSTKQPAEWPWWWEPGELAIDGSLELILDPLASFLEQNGFQVDEERVADHKTPFMPLFFGSKWNSPLKTALIGFLKKSEGSRSVIGCNLSGMSPIVGVRDPRYDSTPGIAKELVDEVAFEAQHGCKPRTCAEWGEVWADHERHAALRKVAKEKEAKEEAAAIHVSSDATVVIRSGGDGKSDVRLPLSTGTVRTDELVTALQTFLKNNGADDLEITHRMGLNGDVLFGVCDNDPTIMALQGFLNRQMLPRMMPF